MSDDLLGGWSLRLSDAFLAYGLRAVGPASYDPDQDIWSRSFSAGHNVGNALASVTVEVPGMSIIEAKQEQRLDVLLSETAGAAAAKYSRLTRSDVSYRVVSEGPPNIGGEL